MGLRDRIEDAVARHGRAVERYQSAISEAHAAIDEMEAARDEAWSIVECELGVILDLAKTEIPMFEPPSINQIGE